MESVEKVARDFAAIYYKKFTYDRANMLNFYAKDALLWRNSFETKEMKSIAEVSESAFLPKIEQGTEVAIADVKIQGEGSDIKLEVNGSIVFDGKAQNMTQEIALKLIDEKWFIVSDSLNLVETDKPIDTKDLVEIQYYRNQGRKNSPRDNKKRDSKRFGVYIPK